VSTIDITRQGPHIADDDSWSWPSFEIQSSSWLDAKDGLSPAYNSSDFFSHDAFARGRSSHCWV